MDHPIQLAEEFIDDMDLNELNIALKHEADDILYGHGLIRILNRFGNSFVGGSYFLDVMSWRDLDIYVDGDNMDVETFFELGRDISLCLRPSKMNYRNEYIGRTEYLPKGYYWGCYAMLNSKAWKVDVWSISSNDFTRKQQEAYELKSKIKGVEREAILKLKNSLFRHPYYRKKFFSVDIYDAVLKDHIHSEESFKEWLFQKKGVCL